MKRIALTLMAAGLFGCPADPPPIGDFDSSVPPGVDAGMMTECSGGRTDCDGVCRDLSSDGFNCGECGRICADGFRCESGTCQMACPSSQMRCDVDGTSICVSTDSDNMNCGSCGNECDGGQVCSAGECSASCDAGLTECMVGDELVCADTDTDPMHCGICGRRCDVGQDCVGGSCVLECDSGEDICGGACVDTDTDTSHCGECDNPCGSDRDCVGGECVRSCEGGETLCGDECVDTDTDRANCGGCSTEASPTACADGEVCTDGSCGTSCGSLTMCGDGCVDTDTDTSHCGECGMECPAPSGGSATCSGGSCGQSCSSGRTLCGSVCRDTDRDSAHCGDCDSPCSSGQTCVSGSCTSTVPPLDADDFQITTLSTTACSFVEHSEETGDDHGGFAVSSSRVFYTGDDGTITYLRTDLSDPAEVTVRWEGMIYDAGNEEAYLLADDTGPLGTSGGVATRLLPLASDGTLTDEEPIALSAPVNATDSLGSDIGLFAGNGRAIVHNGSRLYQILLPSGTVEDLGPMGVPDGANGCEGWSYHGIAEHFGGTLRLIYARSPFIGTDQIRRVTVPDDSDVEVLLTLDGGSDLNLEDMCMIAPSPRHDRWYWHLEGDWTDGAASSEWLGHCDATFDTTGGNLTVTMTDENCEAVDHTSVTGDDRGGLVLTGSNALISGDTATGRYRLPDLTSGERVARVYDSMIGDVLTGSVYMLANDGRVLARGGGTITELIRVNSTNGQLTSTVIELTTPITATSTTSLGDVGLFHGYGGVAIHNGDRAYWIDLPSGEVTDFGTMAAPDFNPCENWAYWGMAEYFGDRLYLTYAKDNGNNFFGEVMAVERARVPDGMTETVQSFTDLSDLCGFAYVPMLRRWYWHHEVGSQIVTDDTAGTEHLGYCPGSHTLTP